MASENPIKELEQEVVFFKRTNKAIRRSLEEISKLQEMLKQIASCKSVPLIIEHFISIIKFYFEYGGFVYYHFNLEDLSLNPKESDRLSDAFLRNYFDVNDSIFIWTLNEKQIATIPAASAIQDEVNIQSRCLLAIPFATVSKFLGVMAIRINTRSENLLTMQTREILHLAANQAAIAIENVLLTEDLNKKNQHLDQMHTFTNNILDSLANGVITLSMGNKITHINRNASMMFAISNSNLIGHEYERVFPDSLSKMIHLLFEQTVEQGYVLDYQLDFELPGGASIPYGVSTSLLKDQSDGLLGMTMVIRDMTASRELDRLRALDKLKNDFVSTVSHELRSPLATIRAYIDTLLNRVDPSETETRNHFLQTIEEEANRLTILVENMLDIASIESGKIQLELAYLDISDLAKSVVELCKMQTTKHTLHLNVQNALPKINLDKNRMTQVLINIVNNAIKYAPDGGNITLDITEDQSAIRVDVKDEGLGIKPEDLRNICEKFFRVDSTKTSNIGGTGLGLAIVKKLVELHGGKLDIASVYGEGSTFSIILPIE